jgi:hypothetical protein
MAGRAFPRNPLDGSICTSCKHMVRRVIIPFNEAEYGIDREAMNIADDEDVIYEHYFCNETALDLDHIVLECSCYKNKLEKNLVKFEL